MFTQPPKPPRPRSFVERYKQEDFTNPTQGGQAAYSVGNRVYNGFSSSPHSGGGLDPTGYQEREMNASSLQRYIKGKR